MKADIHPKYFPTAEVKCSCGNVIVVGSTRESLRTELCSACHPFYTGQQKLVDTAGRVDKFQAKRKASQDLKEETVRRAEAKKKKPEAYKEKEVPAEVLARALASEQTEKAGKWGKPLGETLTEETKKEDAVLLAKEKTSKKPVAKKATTAAKAGSSTKKPAVAAKAGSSTKKAKK